MRTAAVLGLLATLGAAAGFGVRGSEAAFTAHRANPSNTFSTRADWVAPAVTLTAPADGTFTTVANSPLSGAAGNGTGDNPTVMAKIYAGTALTGTPVQTLNATRSGATWSATAATLADGTYTAQATQADGSGNTGTTGANTFTVDTLAPRPVSVDAKDGGTTSGRLGAGDTITFTFDDVIDPASVKSGWDGTNIAVRARFTNGGNNDRFTIQDSAGGTTINLDAGGTTAVATLENLVTGTVTVTGQMTRSADGKSFVIVLGTPPATGVVTTPNTVAKNMTWTAKAGPQDRAGNALVVPGTPVAETDNDLDF